MPNYVINGGGMVGAAAALALANQGHHVTLIDRHEAPANQADWDLRISSVNQHHWAWLAGLGVEQNIARDKVMPYQQLSVTTQAGDRLTFDATDADLNQLGVMVENNALQHALWQCLQRCKKVVFKVPARIERFDTKLQQVQLNTGDVLHYDVLIGADGANSAVARAAGICYRGWDYGQRCLLATVRLKHAIAPATWEVFRPEGPFALLPLTRQQACLIDYRSAAAIRHMSASKDRLNQILRATFADAIGDFEVLRSASFPLQRKHALRYVASNSIVLMGDAAHTIHPLAGQGVNLGFADVRQWLRCGGNVAEYERQRQRDNHRMMRAMDVINWGFRSQQPLVKLALKGLFFGLDRLNLKRQLIATAMQQT